MYNDNISDEEHNLLLEREEEYKETIIHLKNNIYTIFKTLEQEREKVTQSNHDTLTSIRKQYIKKLAKIRLENKDIYYVIKLEQSVKDLKKLLASTVQQPLIVQQLLLDVETPGDSEILLSSLGLILDNMELVLQNKNDSIEQITLHSENNKKKAEMDLCEVNTRVHFLEKESKILLAASKSFKEELTVSQDKNTTFTSQLDLLTSSVIALKNDLQDEKTKNKTLRDENDKKQSILDAAEILSRNKSGALQNLITTKDKQIEKLTTVMKVSKDTHTFKLEEMIKKHSEEIEKLALKNED